MGFSCLKEQCPWTSVLRCCEFWEEGFLCSAELLAKARSCGLRFVSPCFWLSAENFFLYPRAATFLDSLPFPILFKNNGQVTFTWHIYAPYFMVMLSRQAKGFYMIRSNTTLFKHNSKGAGDCPVGIFVLGRSLICFLQLRWGGGLGWNVSVLGMF